MRNAVNKKASRKVPLEKKGEVAKNSLNREGGSLGLRRAAFKKILNLCGLSQVGLCRTTEVFADKGIGSRIYPSQLNRWLHGQVDLLGSTIESLERALPDSERALYYGFLSVEMTTQSSKDAVVLK